MQEQVNSAMESAKEAAASMTERVSDFFQGNPFTTPIGRKIEMATDASALATENWGLNMEICDFINSTAEGGRDAMRAIRKRLHTQMSKNNAVVMYTLTVLETCVKNCDIRFHELVCQKDFISELVRLIGPKFDAPQVIQERVLSLIQSWNDAFRDDPRLQGVCQVYDELKAKGVQFPVADPDSMAPILTPKRLLVSKLKNEKEEKKQKKQISTVFPVQKSPPPTTAITATVTANATAATVSANVTKQGMLLNPGPHYFADPSQPVQPTPEQLEKLRNELDVVNGNLKVMREMLSEMAPGKENPDDLQLLNELHDVLKQMHMRIQDLIRSVQNDEVMYELLILNDDFNNVFEKYNRFMANRTSSSSAKENAEATAKAVPVAVGAAATATATAAPGEGDLIEFDDQTLSQQLGALKTSDASNAAVAARSGSADLNNKQGVENQSEGGAVAANKGAPVSDQEAAEMKAWLEAQEGKKKTPVTAPAKPSEREALLQNESSGDSNAKPAP